MTPLSLPPPSVPSSVTSASALPGAAAIGPSATAEPARSFASVMQAAGPPPATPVSAPAAPAELGPVGKMLSNVAAGHREMDRLIQLASSGRSFSSAQLLGLQARIYRLGNEIDMASKLLEKVTSGVKQAMSTQV